MAQGSNTYAFLDENGESFTNNERLILEYFVTHKSGRLFCYYKDWLTFVSCTEHLNICGNSFLHAKLCKTFTTHGIYILQ